MGFFQQLKKVIFPSSHLGIVHMTESEWVECQDLQGTFENAVGALASYQIICSSDGKPIDYRFLHVNKAFEELTGLKALDVIGKTMRDIRPNMEDSVIDCYGQVALTGKPDVIEEFSAVLGKWYLCHAFSVKKGFLLVRIEDITEQKRSEDALQQAHRQLASITDSTTDLIYRLDAREYFSYVSPVVQVLLGYDPLDVIGQPFQGFILPADLVVWKAANKKVSEGHPVKGVRLRFLRKDVASVVAEINIVPLFLNETIIGQQGIARDITISYKAEEALRVKTEELEEERANLQMIFSSLQIGMFLIDGNAVIQRVNEAMTDIIHKSSEDLIGSSIGQALCCPHLIEEGEKCGMLNACLGCPIRFIFETVLKTGCVVSATEVMWDLVINGETRSVCFEVSAAPVMIDHTCQIAFSVMDVTSRKYAEQSIKEQGVHLQEALAELQRSHETLKHTHEQMIQSEKMAAIGLLAAGVAHEINNPLGFITSNLGVLEKYVQTLSDNYQSHLKLCAALVAQDQGRIHEAHREAEEFQETFDLDEIIDDLGPIVKETHEGCDRIKKIVQDLKSFSQADTGYRETIDLNVVIERVMGILWNEIKYKAELTKEYGQIPLIVVNPRQIEQAFFNVLMNASQSIVKRGRITVRTFLRGNDVVLEVEDTGKGMSKEAVARIFDPFFTTREPGEGPGLGLSISYEIIKRHQGSVSIDSVIDAGTKVTIILPVPVS